MLAAGPPTRRQPEVDSAQMDHESWPARDDHPSTSAPGAADTASAESTGNSEPPQ